MSCHREEAAAPLTELREPDSAPPRFSNTRRMARLYRKSLLRLCTCKVRWEVASSDGDLPPFRASAH